MTTNLKKTIMRRVYYSYAISIATSTALWQGVLLGASIALFGRLTHVAAISHNVSSVPLSSTPDFVFHAFVNALNGGEVLTVLVSVFMIGLSISFITKALPVVLSLRKLQTT
jgi:Na+/H+-dicarboxylate symporter